MFRGYGTYTRKLCKKQDTVNQATSESEREVHCKGNCTDTGVKCSCLCIPVIKRHLKVSGPRALSVTTRSTLRHVIECLVLCRLEDCRAGMRRLQLDWAFTLHSKPEDIPASPARNTTPRNTHSVTVSVGFNAVLDRIFV